MTAPRALLAAVLVVTAVFAQTTLVAPLHLPYGRPDLVLVVVVAIALAGGPTAGMAAGFGGGLLSDLLSDHPAGLLALVLCVVGFCCGLLADAEQRSFIVRLMAVAGAAAVALIGYPGLLAIIGSPRLDWRIVAGDLPGSVAYDVILALVVVPTVAAMYRRLDPLTG